LQHGTTGNHGPLAVEHVTLVRKTERELATNNHVVLEILPKQLHASKDVDYHFVHMIPKAMQNLQNHSVSLDKITSSPSPSKTRTKIQSICI
jgi:hypothetical protein